MNYYGDMDSAKRAIEERYSGEFDSELDFSTELLDELYGSEIPDHLQYYIDYEVFNRDIFISDYLAIPINGKVHVFFKSDLWGSCGCPFLTMYCDSKTHSTL